MKNLRVFFDEIDTRITRWMARHGVRLLRISLGVVFFWFGVLKFFPGLSPAQALAANTMNVLTFGKLDPQLTLAVLATWECVIALRMGRFVACHAARSS